MSYEVSDAVSAAKMAQGYGYISKAEAKAEARNCFATVRAADQVKGQAKALRMQAKELRRKARRLDKLVK